MVSCVLRVVVPGCTILAVLELSRRMPRAGELLLSLPLVSILACGATWFRDHNLKSLSTMARVTLILVPLGLPFFVPLAFAERLGLGFWPVMGQRLLHLHREHQTVYGKADLLNVGGQVPGGTAC